jgi:hypothetical protein
MWWDFRQYIRDVTTRNYSLGFVTRILTLRGLQKLMGIGVAYRVWLWLYNRIATRAGMPAHFDVHGAIPNGQPTPPSGSDLRAGDWVRVRSLGDIVQTINASNRNKGLSFDHEAVGYCGSRYQVHSVVEKIIDERKGTMLAMHNPCITLAGAICKGEYSPRRLMCPRASIHYFRPLWVERVAPEQRGSGTE